MKRRRGETRLFLVTNSPKISSHLFAMRLTRFAGDLTKRGQGGFAARRGRAPLAELATVCLALVFALALSFNALASIAP